jgi:steroid delta-isomerase
VTDDIITRYANAFAALTPDTMDALLATTSPDIRFTDPFNDVTGHAAFRRIFQHMFETCDAPRFHIIDIAHGTQSDEQRAYLRWRMSGRIKSWPHTSLDFEGMSEVHVGKDGLISTHIDHWDSASQLLVRLPLIGALMRPMLRLFKVRTDES